VHNADNIETRILLEGASDRYMDACNNSRNSAEASSLYVEIVQAKRVPAAAVLGLLPDTYCCISLLPADQPPSERPLLGHSSNGVAEGVMVGGHLVFNVPPQYSTGL
jgi:hypothetical protein